MDFIIGDNNHDGVVDVHDQPFEPGSPEAQEQWQVVDAECRSPEAIAKAKAAGFENATGFYKGKPISDVCTGKAYNTYNYVVDKVHLHDGLPKEVAYKIAKRFTSAMEWID